LSEKIDIEGYQIRTIGGHFERWGPDHPHSHTLC